MRMSSGPSCRNENPRSARSSWGDETPRSTRKPSTGTSRARPAPRAPPRTAHGPASPGPRTAPAGSRAAAIASRIAIEPDQPAVGRRPFQNGPGMPAQPERRVAIPPAGPRGRETPAFRPAGQAGAPAASLTRTRRSAGRRRRRQWPHHSLSARPARLSSFAPVRLPRDFNEIRAMRRPVATFRPRFRSRDRNSPTQRVR